MLGMGTSFVAADGCAAEVSASAAAAARGGGARPSPRPPMEDRDPLTETRRADSREARRAAKVQPSAAAGRAPEKERREVEEDGAAARPA